MGTWVAGIIVILIAGFALYSVLKNRKKGNSCGCGCENCPKTNDSPKKM